MTCTVCRFCESVPGQATVTLERGNSTFVFKGVPAQVCENCGEQYIDEQVSAYLLKQAQAAAGNGVWVKVRSFAA